MHAPLPCSGRSVAHDGSGWLLLPGRRAATGNRVEPMNRVEVVKAMRERIKLGRTLAAATGDPATATELRRMANGSEAALPRLESPSAF